MSAQEPIRSEMAEVSTLDFFLLVSSVFCFSFVLGGIFAPHSIPLDETPKLTDLMVIAITLSGVTIPIMITYMSLGRNRDVFSELGDAMPFFLSSSGLQAEDLPNALLSDTETEDGQFELDVAALNELNSLRTASGIYLSTKHKLHLVPQHAKRSYLYYLHGENDQRLSRLYAWLIGVPALICSLIIFITHFDGEPVFLKFLAHSAAIMAVIGNICCYRFLLKIANLRGAVQKDVAKRLHGLIAGLSASVPQAIERTRGNAETARRQAKTSAQRLALETP